MEEFMQYEDKRTKRQLSNTHTYAIKYKRFAYPCMKCVAFWMKRILIQIFVFAQNEDESYKQIYLVC